MSGVTSRGRSLFVFVTAGPVKAAYLPLVEDQAIRSSCFSSKSGRGNVFTRGFFFNE